MSGKARGTGERKGGGGGWIGEGGSGREMEKTCGADLRWRRQFGLGFKRSTVLDEAVIRGLVTCFGGHTLQLPHHTIALTSKCILSSTDTSCKQCISLQRGVMHCKTLMLLAAFIYCLITLMLTTPTRGGWPVSFGESMMATSVGVLMAT